MKVALTHLRHAQVGGTELFMNQLARALVLAGHEVTIICRTHEAAPHPEVRFVVLTGWALGRGHRLWRFARMVERHLTTHHYDIVLGLGRTWSQDVVRVGGGLYREQIVIGRGHRRYWPKDLTAEAIERRTFAPGNYRMVISNSLQTERSLKRQYQVPDDMIVTIHNAVDTSRFSPELRSGCGAELRSRCGFTAEHRVYLFLGSGYRRKGLDRLLPAFAGLAENCPQARLMVVGFDSQQAKYQAQADELGLTESVVFLGGRRDAECCYNAADCYVLPTRFDAFGFSVIEALACGLPVVVTNTAGAAEVVTPEVGQVVASDVDDKMIPQLTEAMLHYSDPAADSMMRTKATALAAQHGVEVVMARNIALLEEVAVQKQQ